MPRFSPLSKFGWFVVYSLGRRLFLPLSASDSQLVGIVMGPRLSQSGSPAGIESIASGSMSRNCWVDSWCLWWYPVIFSGGSSSVPVIIPATGWLLCFLLLGIQSTLGLFVSIFYIWCFSLPLILWTSMTFQQSALFLCQLAGVSLCYNKQDLG